MLSRLLARDGGKLYLKELGLTLPQWRVLSTLGIFGEYGVSAIAEHCSMDRGQASRTIDQLIALGLIRLRPDPLDGRGILLSLSNEGESRYAAGIPIAFNRQRKLVSGFKPEEIKAFSHTLDQMIARVEAEKDQIA